MDMEKNLFKCVCCGNYAVDGCIFDCVCLACIESNFIDTISDIGIYKQIPQSLTSSSNKKDKIKYEK